MFPNVLFLLIIWEFRILHPAHIQLLIFPDPLPPISTPMISEKKKKKRNKKKKVKSKLCSPMYSQEHGQTPSDLQENRVLPHPQPCQKTSTVKGYTLVSLTHFFFLFYFYLFCAFYIMYLDHIKFLFPFPLHLPSDPVLPPK